VECEQLCEEAEALCQLMEDAIKAYEERLKANYNLEMYDEQSETFNKSSSKVHHNEYV